MRIIFLNTYNGKLREAISEFIAEQKKKTDIFCFQEAFFSGTSFRRISDSLLSDYTSIDAMKDTKENNEYYGQVTYVTKKIKICESRILLHEEAQQGLALVVTIEYNNRRIHVTNMHGTPNPGTKKDTPQRIKQSEALINFAKEKKGDHIIGGDFNLDINTESIKLFEREGFINLIRAYKIPTTRNKIAWDRHPETPQMYADYIFITQNISIKSFTVPPDIVSDHQAMIVEIES